ncbi:MAG: aspartate aminotransferase family protein [Candidatus Thermoplasmatota archaeon]|nr:aspartate aminotransferase family protein [Candidatus Thermoplasmatota archaeon]
MRGANGLTDGHIFYRDLAKDYIMAEKGEGIYLIDKEGNRIIDGAAGAAVVCLGHGNERVVKALTEQASILAYTHMSTFTNEPVLRLSAELIKLTPRRLNRVYFASGGSEAVETSLKLARQYHVENGNLQKYKIISRSTSYHGATIGALSMTGHYPRRKHYLPLLTQFPRISTPYCWRCPFGKVPQSCDFECAYDLERAIISEDPENISAFIAEPIIGASAPAVGPPRGYYRIIQKICHKYDVLFIADEVMTGYGRTGKFFAMEHYEVFPDMIVLSKGISSGYSPLGALIIDEKVYDVIANAPGSAFVHGHTFAGNPLSAAVGLEVLRIIQEEKLVDRAAKLGEYFLKGLNTLKKHPMVGDVRCVGLLAGIEFVHDRKSRKPFPEEYKVGGRLQRICLKNGLYVYPGRVSSIVDGGDHILMAPPFIITEDQLDEIVNILDRSIAQLQKELEVHE